MLSVLGMHLSIDNKKILKGISFSIDQNECISIIGPSGCGKSSLLKSINGSIFSEISPICSIREKRRKNIENLPYGYLNGEIRFKDTLLEYKTLHEFESRDSEKIRNNILYIANTADFKIATDMSILDFMIFSRQQKKTYSTKERIDQQDKFADQLARVGLQYSKHLKVSSLSSGERQKLLIAVALINNPSALLLDEPCSNMDPHSSIEIEEIMRTEILQKGVPIIFATHNLTRAARLSDSYMFLSYGYIEENGNGTQLSSPRTDRLQRYVEEYKKTISW